jgi:hypothetical protein
MTQVDTALYIVLGRFFSTKYADQVRRSLLYYNYIWNYKALNSATYARVAGYTGSLVLEAFVFEISSKSLGAQKKYYCQIKAEILKFMWVCGKSQSE